MPAAVDIGSLIARSPEIRKGRPCIAGTGVTVRRIAGWYNLGLTAEEIVAKLERQPRRNRQRHRRGRGGSGRNLSDALM